MDAPNKRTLTDKVRETVSYSDEFSRSLFFGTPEDLVLRLRNAAARGRKSVLEGYKTAPTMSKAQSTGTLIFRSMNDTLADVYSNNNPSSSPNNGQISRKRSHSFTDQDEQGDIPERISQNDEPDNGSWMPLAPDSTAPRPVKSLRVSRRSIFGTRSVPNGVLEVKNSPDNDIQASKMDDEEDWSQKRTFQSSEQSFEPMVLE